MKIKEVMAQPILVPPSATKKDIFRLLKKNVKAELVVVIDDRGRFLGDITLDDLFLMFLPNEQYEEIGVELAFDLQHKFFAEHAKDIMRRHDFSCSPDEDLVQVAFRLASLEINELPVITKEGVVKGYVTQRMLIRYLKAP